VAIIPALMSGNHSSGKLIGFGTHEWQLFQRACTISQILAHHLESQLETVQVNLQDLKSQPETVQINLQHKFI